MPDDLREGSEPSRVSQGRGNRSEEISQPGFAPLSLSDRAVIVTLNQTPMTSRDTLNATHSMHSGPNKKKTLSGLSFLLLRPFS